MKRGLGNGDAMQSAAQRVPRILVTGFSVFHDVADNPTETLVRSLEADAFVPARRCDLTYCVLDVDYAGLPASLAALDATGNWDVAIHFGVSARASGFVLERTARNGIGPRPDVRGFVPPTRQIELAGPEELPSSLPLSAIETALRVDGLPVSWSDSAGDYLCNFLFYSALRRLTHSGRPGMAGFIHVAPTDAAPRTGLCLSAADLRRGAEIVIGSCADSWAVSAAG